MRTRLTITVLCSMLACGVLHAQYDAVYGTVGLTSRSLHSIAHDMVIDHYNGTRPFLQKKMDYFRTGSSWHYGGGFRANGVVFDFRMGVTKTTMTARGIVDGELQTREYELAEWVYSLGGGYLLDMGDNSALEFGANLDVINFRSYTRLNTAKLGRLSDRYYLAESIYAELHVFLSEYIDLGVRPYFRLSSMEISASEDNRALNPETWYHDYSDSYYGYMYEYGIQATLYLMLPF